MTKILSFCQQLMGNVQSAFRKKVDVDEDDLMLMELIDLLRKQAEIPADFSVTAHAAVQHRTSV